MLRLLRRYVPEAALASYQHIANLTAGAPDGSSGNELTGLADTAVALKGSQTAPPGAGLALQPSQLITELESKPTAMFKTLSLTDRATLTYLRAVNASRAAGAKALPGAAAAAAPPPPPALAGRWVVCAASGAGAVCGVAPGGGATDAAAAPGGGMPLMTRANVSAVLVHDVELDAHLPPGVLAAAALFDAQQLKQ